MTMTEKFLARLEAHPAVQALEREDREAAYAERKRLAGERARIADAHSKRRPALVKARDEASAIAVRAHDAWRQAADVAFAADSALTDTDHVADVACSRIEQALRATAPRAIAAFVAQLDARLDAVRREPPIATVSARLDYGEPEQVIATSYAALNAWLTRGAEVRSRALDLALEALDEAALQARFKALTSDLGPTPGRESATVVDPALEPMLRRALAAEAPTS